MRFLMFALWVLMIPVGIFKPDERPSRKHMGQLVFGRLYKARYLILFSPLIIGGLVHQGFNGYVSYKKASLERLAIEKMKELADDLPDEVVIAPKLLEKPVVKLTIKKKPAKAIEYNFFVFRTISDCRDSVEASRGFESFGSCDISVVGSDVMTLSNAALKPTGFVFAFPKRNASRDSESNLYFPIYKSDTSNMYQYGSGHVANESSFYAGKDNRMTKEQLMAVMLGSKDAAYPYQVIEEIHPHVVKPTVETKQAVVTLKKQIEDNDGAEKLTSLPKATNKQSSFNFHVFNEVEACDVHVAKNSSYVEGQIDCGVTFPSNSPMSIITKEKYELSGLVTVVKRNARAKDTDRFKYYPVFKLSNLALASDELPIYIYGNGKKSHADGFYPFNLSEKTINNLFI